MSDAWKVHRFVLGSLSPYRKSLLEGVGFWGPWATVMGSTVNEKKILGETPRDTAVKRARAKAFDVARQAKVGDLILGADQVLGFQGQVYDKANSEEEAATRLQEFQGKTHFLHSALVLILVSPEGGLHEWDSMCVDIPMSMRPLSAEEISSYVSTGEWVGSVGCYKIESKGIQLFETSSSNLEASLSPYPSRSAFDQQERNTRGRADHPLGDCPNSSSSGHEKVKNQSLLKANEDFSRVSYAQNSEFGQPLNFNHDHSAIIGLPLVPFFSSLRRLGINPLLAPDSPWMVHVQALKTSIGASHVESL